MPTPAYSNSGEESIMARVGVIKEIWRFPVKSMQGDTIERCKVTQTESFFVKAKDPGAAKPKKEAA